MKSYINISLYDLMEIFNNISKILYAEIESKQETMLRTFKVGIIDEDIDQLMSFKMIKEYNHNLISKYRFYVSNDPDSNCNTIFKIYITKDIADGIKLGFLKPLFNNYMTICCIYIDDSLLKDETSNEDKYRNLAYMFYEILFYYTEANYNNNVEIYNKINNIAKILANLIIDYKVDSKKQNEIVDRILSNDLVNGFSNIMIAKAHYDNIYNEFLKA